MKKFDLVKFKESLTKLFVCIFTIISVCVCGLNNSYAANNLQITIYAGVNAISDSASSGLGNSHAWIVIKNCSPVEIGTYTLDTNKSLTMGLFGNTSRKGIWYNKEANDRHLYQNNSYIVYLTATVSHSKISAIEEVVENHNYWGLLTHNCAHFAVKVRNASGATSIDTSAEPAALRSRIMSKSGYKIENTQSDWVNSNKDETWYYVNAISPVSDEEILSGKSLMVIE